MKERFRIMVGLIFFGLLLTGCNPSYSENNSYTVTWKNYDGTVLETDTKVEKGAEPSYDGKTPTRESTQQYSYVFDKWSPDLSPVVSDITYTATYLETRFASKILFDLDGGTTTSSTNPIYVASIKAEDFFFNVTKENYNFRGWSYNGQKVFDQKGNLLFNPEMAESMTFKAIFAQDAYLTIVSNLSGAGTITGEGTYAYNSYVDVKANTNRGYVFIGWYDYATGTLLSNQETYKYMMRSKDVTLEARFKYGSYTMAVKTAHPLLGSVMIKDDSGYNEQSSKTFDYLSNVTISAYTKTDKYRFLGWFNESGSLVETNAVYTFTMPYNDYNLVAKRDAPSFTVNVLKNHENGGTITGSGSYEYNSLVTVSTTTNKGYTFNGIYKNGNKITSSDSYTFNMPLESLQLMFNWDLINYRISYQLNGGINSSSNPSTYNVESSTIRLANPTRTGYKFLGRTCNGSSITSIPTGSTGDITLVANWNISTYVITLDANGGTCSQTSLNITYGDTYSLPTPNRDGYTFDGWYNGSSKFDQSGTWTYTNNLTLKAHWNVITYNITYQLNGGTNSSYNPTTYNVESPTIGLANPTKTGYTFLGRTCNGSPITSIPTGSIGDITLVANWTASTYVITLDANGGTCSISTLNVVYGEAYSLPTPSRDGYTFDSWYFRTSKFDQSGTWTYTNNLTLTAKWIIVNYSIVYNLNGGTNSSSNPSSYTVESSTITLANPTKVGYTFTGWFDENDNQITEITAGSIGDLYLTAQWSANQYVLTVISEDISKGTVTIISGSGYTDELITVEATPLGEWVFKGWYHNGIRVSESATYTFTMPSNDYSLLGCFFTEEEAEAEEQWKIAHGLIPTISEDEKTITYGLYPQTNVNDSSLVSSLNALTTTEPNGWYLYNEDYYAKVSANPAKSGYEFDNGTAIISGTTYWFKCEPIIWNVLSNTDSEYYILSSVLLDSCDYYKYHLGSRTIDGKTIYPNNYEYSDIRSWLNNDFYNSAFALSNSSIQTKTIDNSAETTRSNSNQYACNNTIDKVFLPSYKDYVKSSYGFSSSYYNSDTRYCKTTDWARARGAYCRTDSSYLYNGYYWTRSPVSSGDGMSAVIVDAYGSISGDFVDTFMDYNDGRNDMSVRPAISIKIVYSEGGN